MRRTKAMHVVCLAAATVAASAVRSAGMNNTPAWVGPLNGNWTTGSNWSTGASPNDTSDSANFLLQPTSSLGNQVVLDANQTVGSMTFNTPFRSLVVPPVTQRTLTISTVVTVNAGPFETADFFAPGHSIGVNIAGSSGLVKNGSGNLALVDLTGLPSVTSTFTGGVTVNAGTLTFTSDTQLGAGANNISLANGTSLHMFGGSALTTVRSISIAAGTANLTSLKNLTINGSISGPGGNLTIDTFFGAGLGSNLQLNGVNTYNGATVIRDNSGLALDTPNGTIASSSRIELGGGLFLNLTNTNTNRIADSAEVFSYGGAIVQNGRSAGTSETMGTLHLVNGGSTFVAVDSTSSTIRGTLTFASLDRQNRSTAFFRGRNLGNSPAAGVGNVFFTAAPALVGGGGAAGSKNISILPYATGQSDITTLSSAGLVTYVAGGGIRPLVDAEYQSSLAAGGATDNYKVTGPQVNNVSKTINALVLGASNASVGGSVTGSGTLVISSGAIVSTDTSSDGAAGVISNNIDFGSAEGIFNNVGSTTNGIYIDGQIFGTNGVTFAGGGNVILVNTNNSFTGQLTVTRGTLLVHGNVPASGISAIGASTNPIILTKGNNTQISGNAVTSSPFTSLVLADPGTTYARDIIVRNGPGASIRQGVVIVGTNINAHAGSVTYSGNITIEGGTLSPLGPATELAPTPNDLTTTGIDFTGAISGPGRVDDLDVFFQFGLNPATSNSPVIRFSGANTYSGGTSITNSVWQVNSNSVLSGSTITSGPFGTGTLAFEGSPSVNVPTPLGSLMAFGAARTVANPVIYQADPHFVGSQTLTLSGTHNLAGRNVNFDISSSADVLLGGVVSGGAITKSGTGRLVLSASNTYTGGTTVNTGTVQIAVGGTAGTGTLTLNPATFVDIAPGRGNDALKLSALSIAGTGTVDLNDNDMIVGSATSRSIVEAYVATARNGGTWDQPGLTSSTARALGPSGITGLGVIGGSEYTSFGHLDHVFSGQTYADADTLVKYTYNGDANLSGQVNFDDYVRIDVGFNTNLTGWSNGDFNYSGQVNFDDYVMIDVAFNTQGGTLGRAIRYLTGEDRSESGRDAAGIEVMIEHLEEFGTPYAQAFLAAVPEPTMLLPGGAIALATALRRRRRRRR